MVIVPPKETAVPLIVILELAKSELASCPVMFVADKSTAKLLVPFINSLTIPPFAFNVLLDGDTDICPCMYSVRSFILKLFVW